ncbi:MAG TPA: M23 family metallopeptidase [Thermoanaerobaculia bacterium]|nr:M23 family metallopeptidase [Thermoanaerobaculia bacterium]
MNRKTLPAFILLLTFAVLPSAEGAELRIAGFRVTSLETVCSHARAPGAIEPGSIDVGSNAVIAPDAYRVYPVAGRTDADVFIPYYVDLQPGPGVRDWNCGRLAFEGHSGHDPYIRSFAEQDIGVPVFAALDGVVVDVHDAEPDKNVVADSAARANVVVIDHSPWHRSIYRHLKQGSATVAKGEWVAAGTEIGMVGSSGASVGPHIHFESRLEGQFFEPLAGPCREGVSLLANQPATTNGGFRILDVAFSSEPFASFPEAPFDQAPRTGTYLSGPRQIHLQVDAANIRTALDYRITLVRPDGSGLTPVTGSLATSSMTSRSTYTWALDTNLDTTGDWMLLFEVNNQVVARAPIRVVGSAAQVVNRPPKGIAVELTPSSLRAADVAICRVNSDLLFRDPDYDVVRYQYRWTVDGEVVRERTTAAMTDVLSREHVIAGTRLRCEVTASDGTASATPAAATVDVEAPSRRRGVIR